jgi:hypothetical protein
VCAAEDFTGQWNGSFVSSGPDGKTRNEEIFMTLKQKGADLTGTAGPDATIQWPLSNGHVAGTKLTFDVTSGEGPQLKFTLTFAAGHLKGDVAGTMGTQKLSAKVDAQRKAPPKAP